jgi:hypothetical protein
MVANVSNSRRVVSCLCTKALLDNFIHYVKYSVVLVLERTVPRDRHLSARLVPTFADRGCHVVSATDSYDRILVFQDRSHYFSFK